MDHVIALYMRSSMEQDQKTRNAGNPDESDTIANQRKMLHNAALVRGLDAEHFVEYVDDGYSGVNFERPAFRQLLDDVDAGMVSTILVKDFSRMGRDYIGVGEYVEQYFPVRGVRIISVNDGWDSEEHRGETLELDAAFHTMIYEMYSRDLSVKRKSANQARNNRGVFIGAFVPYGYKKIPGDSHSIVLDEETAPVVRRIFELYNAGEKTGNIARILTEEGVPTPAMEKNDRIPYENKVSNIKLWSAQTVSRILRDETYVGTLLLNRYRIAEFRSKSMKKNKEAEWMKFPDNHEAIISRETFEKVQKRLGKKRKEVEFKKGRGLPVYCGHCGRKLSGTTRNEETMICENGCILPMEPCGQIQIRKDVLKDVLIKAVKTEARVLLKASEQSMYGKEQKKMEQIRADLEAELKSYHDKRMDLYKLFRAERISMEDFLKRKSEVLKQEEECQGELVRVEERLEKQREQAESAVANTEKFRQYSCIKTFDPDVINALISKIEVYNDGHIKICWNHKDEFGCAADRKMDYGMNGETKAQEKEYRAAVYTADMFLKAQPAEPDCGKDKLMKYCRENIGATEKEVAVFHDQKEDKSLFYRKGLMKFIDIGRRGCVEIMVIRSFRDLYLSHQEFHNFMTYVIPKLPCRFIAVDDGFDSENADEECRKEIYEKYKGVRKSDLIAFRAQERAEGKREAQEVVHCRKLYGYYRKEDGCYAVPEVLNIIRRIYADLKKYGQYKPVKKWLRSDNIETPKAFFNRYEGLDREIRMLRWDSEKIWTVIKQEGYVSQCRYYKTCMAMGRHCDCKPIVDRETFDEVNEKCRYRNR